MCMPEVIVKRHDSPLTIDLSAAWKALANTNILSTSDFLLLVGRESWYMAVTGLGFSIGSDGCGVGSRQGARKSVKIGGIYTDNRSRTDSPSEDRDVNVVKTTGLVSKLTRDDVHATIDSAFSRSETKE
uniref:Uncharacterized protein n=1 Tax=Hyaloperonospora arabidopsidis (strain Emoy2) TaxID=559515 RepID=M4BI82_HYAAE